MTRFHWAIVAFIVCLTITGTFLAIVLHAAFQGLIQVWPLFIQILEGAAQ